MAQSDDANSIHRSSVIQIIAMLLLSRVPLWVDRLSAVRKTPHMAIFYIVGTGGRDDQPYDRWTTDTPAP